MPAVRHSRDRLALPTKGPIAFVPPKGWNPAKPTKRLGPGDREPGYVDAYNYRWRWDPKKGEWDVQLQGGKGKLSVFGKDANHANISPTGKVTH